MAEETNEGLQQEGTPDPGTASEQPEWFMADRFGSIDEQARSYNESEKRLQEALTERNRERQERERIEQERDELYELQQQSPPQSQFQDPNQNPFVLAYQRAVEEGDVAAQLAIQAQLMNTVVEQRLETQAKESGQDRRGLDPYLVQREGENIAAKYGNDEALKAKAFEIMETHPVISRRVAEIDKDPNATMGDVAAVVETAYELAKGGIVQNQQQQTLAQQQLEQERAKERKLGQESLSGTGGRVASQDEQAQAWERIQAAKSTGLRLG